MQSKIFKPLPFLPARHHLNRWAAGYFLVKHGFSNSIIQRETTFTYKQIRRIRSDLGISERRKNCYGQDVLSATEWLAYTAAIQVYCELREKKIQHIEAVIEAHEWLSQKWRRKNIDINGFYVACDEIHNGAAIFSQCRYCNVEVFTGPGLRDRLGSRRCPACGQQNWERPSTAHRVGHIAQPPQSQQQTLF
ncbi:hypothetical protein [Vibrio cholerae]|uniref:hypothetical protein n=1 Tax=Vibrio cholerae TaxID=666 RepID=UPI002AB4CA02|nr:hypothetical protein [Vibrio cholerae]MDY7587522.1 hypothetical protein [Vibrio cholerae]